MEAAIFENETEVTVAIPVTPFPPVFEMDLPDPAQGATWDELPQVTFKVRRDETLKDVLGRACADLGLRVGAEALAIDRKLAAERGAEPASDRAVDWLRYVGFRQDGDEDIVDRYGEITILRRDQRIHRTALVTRNEEGHATWRRPPFEVTMAELLDAFEAKLLIGNPREIYLVPQVPQGDAGLLGQWDALVSALTVLWEAAGVADRLAGVYGFAELARKVLRRRSEEGKAVIEAHASDWTERGAAPRDLLEMLAATPRRSQDVASLMGCSIKEAEAMLWVLGFSYDDEAELWTHAGDPVADFISVDLELAFNPLLESEDEPESLGSLARERLERLALEGKAPSYADEHERLRRRMVDRLNLPADD